MTDETRSRGEVDARIREELRRHHASPHFPSREIESEIEARVGALPAGGRVRDRSNEGGAQDAGHAPSSGRRAVPDDIAWWRRGPATSLLSAAAALLVFIGGVEYGRRSAQPVATDLRVATAVDDAVAGEGTFEALGPAEPVSLPLSIQSAGSEYIATLARFSGASNQLPQEQREIAREVAMTVLYGAALELLEAAGDDRLLEQVVSEIGRRRFETDGGSSLLPESEL